MSKKEFPEIIFYDNDFVDVYAKAWAVLQNFWYQPSKEEETPDGYLFYPNANENPDAPFIIDQMDAIWSSFFLVYSNRNFAGGSALSFLYDRQEEDGAIRCRYDFRSKEPIVSAENPDGVGLPLFAWAEFNLFHKTGNKKRVKEVFPCLHKYMMWLEKFKDENGLYATPLGSTGMTNSPRRDAKYFIDFNVAVAINALYMTSLADILNDKDMNFVFKRQYFMLKTKINSLMWDEQTGFYYDLDSEGRKVMRKTIASYWPLIAEIPNEDKAEKMIAHLTNPEEFGAEHPFPTLSMDDPDFTSDGDGYRGSVFPQYTFMVIKGLEKYQRYELARESTLKHLYFILEVLSPEGERYKGSYWEAYLPKEEAPARNITFSEDFPRQNYITTIPLSTVTLMIENIIGLSISLSRKTVDWTIPSVEAMGIQNLLLKRNHISIRSEKDERGQWMIRMRSEKLYYFTINILGLKKKTLPIPSGMCSMNLDKI